MVFGVIYVQFSRKFWFSDRSYFWGHFSTHCADFQSEFSTPQSAARPNSSPRTLRGDPGRSHCIWIDESWWEKHNETTLASISLLNQNLFAKKTVGELRRRGSPMKTVAWVITEDLNQHHSVWMEICQCGKEVVGILPIDLTWAVLEIDLTSGHEYKNPRYTSCTNYWLRLLKVWKYWVQNCGCGRVSKLLNCVLS